MGGETGERAGPWAFPLAASVPRELTVTSAPGSEKQGREQQLHILLKLLLKMTRHFPGNVTTIWALGTGDEAESRGGQALVTTHPLLTRQDLLSLVLRSRG